MAMMDHPIGAAGAAHTEFASRSPDAPDREIGDDRREDLPRAKDVFGLLEIVSGQVIEGWAFDPAAPAQALSVVVTINGATVWSGPADIFREDLAGAKVGDGRHAFRVPVDPAWLAEAGPDYMVQALVPAADAELPGSPHTLRWSPPPPAPPLPAPPLPAFLTAEPVMPAEPVTPPGAASGFAGCLDRVENDMIRGWAFDARSPQVSVLVDLFDGDRLIGRIDADLFRVDLAGSGIGDGRHAFALPTPAALRDGRPHVVSAVVSNTAFQLQHSPLTVALDCIPPQQVLAELETQMQAMARTVEHLRRAVGAVAEQAEAGIDRYQPWHAAHGTIIPEQREAMRQILHALPVRPRFSILMPTYNTRADYLAAAIRSVQAQIYPDWELCIADDASGPDTVAALQQAASLDPRIKLACRATNGRIAAATNTAMALATGDYVCFLDHDDALSEDALFQLARVIARDAPDLVYSDEDKFGDNGRPHSPHFKPDFNYSLALGHNYLCHFLAVRRTLAEQVGPLRSEFDGAQDYDFILRCLERIDPAQVAHVPLVLYHWRAHAGSTATTLAAKSYATQAGLDAVSHHLRRRGHDAMVQTGPGGTHRITWPLPAERPTVSVIIPTRDQARTLATCLTSLTRLTEYAPLDILIVDNRSTEPATFELLREATREPNVRVLEHDEEFNFSAICNRGAAAAAGELLLFLNNDIEVLDGGWLTEMVRQICRPQVGAVGAKLVYPDGRIQHAGVTLGIGGVAGHSHKLFDLHAPGYMNRPNMTQEISACTAACLLVRRAAFEAVGGFDEVNLPVAFNDVDFCLRLREAGHAVIYTPHAVLRHHESLSRGAEDSPAKALRSSREIAYMMKRWDKLLTADPFYSPNLTLKHENFALDTTRAYARL